MSTLTVGEVARAVGVSTKAIRVWESKGLIPHPERDDARYRVFTQDDLALARFVSQAKSLGLTLSEIKDIIDLQRAGSTPCQRVLAAIDQHLEEIDQALADLQQLRQTLLTARDGAACGKESGDRSHICRIIEGREQSPKPATPTR